MEIANVMRSIRERLGADTFERLSRQIADQLDELAAELTALYQAKIPAYERFDQDVVHDNTRMVLAFVLDQVSAPEPTLAMDGVAAMARSLGHQGVPLDSVGQSLQLGARRMVQIVREHGQQAGVPYEDLAALQDVAWEWATEGAAALQAVQQELAIAGAARRADLVRRIVSGAMTSAELTGGTQAQTLSADHPYFVLCAAAGEGGAYSDLVTALRVHGSTQALPVVDAVLDDVLVALVPRLPDRVKQDLAVGVGPAAVLTSARASFLQARRALLIAEQHARVGLIDLTDLGALVLLDQAGDAAQALDALHLQPVRDLGASGEELLTTLEEFLARERRIDETATALHVHRNTVRYRLSRFSTVSGLDLEQTDHVVLAWWLLHHTVPAKEQS